MRYMALVNILACFVLSTSATAHVTLSPATSGRGPVKLTFTVPHGCNGSPTTSVRITIPAGIIGVKPRGVSGWSVSVARGPYARSYSYFHGSSLGEGAKSVTWSGGSLSDHAFEEFSLIAFVSDAFKANDEIAFPVLQTCQDGSHDWSEVRTAEKASVKSPAPMLTVVTPAEQAPASTSLATGSIRIGKPWVRATPGGSTVSAGYVQLHNTGTRPDRLVSIAADVAGRTELHEIRVEDGVAKMREASGGIPLPPGGIIELAPGGLHGMLIALKRPLEAGERIPIELRFENAPAVTVDFEVRPVAGGKPSQPHH